MRSPDFSAIRGGCVSRLPIVALLVTLCAAAGCAAQDSALATAPDVDVVDRSIWFEAVSEGNARIIEALLEQDIDPLIKHEGLTAMHIAAREGYLDIVRLLVDAAVDVNLVPDTDEAQIAAVAQHGSPRMIQLVVGRSVPADEVARAMSVRTPLNLAVEARHHDIASYLVQSGADVNLGGLWYRPLHTAVLNGDLAMVELLLDSHARVNKSVRIHDRSTFAGFRYARPLELARIIEREDIAALLREHGAR